MVSVKSLIGSARAAHRPLPLAVWRTAESYVRQAIPALSAPLVRLGDYDAVVVADVHDLMGRGLMRYGFHDPVGWAAHQVLAPGDCFIDAGANIGLITLVAAARVGATGHGISCEPVPATAAMLRRNVEANGFSWVTIEQRAVGETRGSAQMTAFHASAGHHSFAPPSTAEGHPVVVDVSCLDELAATLPAPPALVKLDVEGAEVKALRGARELVAARTTTFIIEVEPEHLQRQGTSVQELRETFIDYEAFAIETKRGGGFALVHWHGAWDEDLPTSPNLVLRPAG